MRVTTSWVEKGGVKGIRQHLAVVVTILNSTVIDHQLDNRLVQLLGQGSNPSTRYHSITASSTPKAACSLLLCIVQVRKAPRARLQQLLLPAILCLLESCSQSSSSPSLQHTRQNTTATVSNNMAAQQTSGCLSRSGVLLTVGCCC